MRDQKVPKTINDFISDNVQALARLFPAAVKDGQVDFTALKEELGQFEEVDKEKYELTWAGKQEAKTKAQEDVFGRTLKYIHEDSKNPETTENLYIEGDNLEVLKLLRQNYYGSIKLIYIDPPYNTGNDFVYHDNFKMDAKESDIAEGAVDEFGERMQKNQKSTNRFHAKWLNMMYPRLKVAKDLLTDDGVIFISIDDNEVDNLKKICDEIFGEDNFIGLTVRVSSPTQNIAKYISIMHDYTLVYCKNKTSNSGNWSVKKNNVDEFESRAKKLIRQGLKSDEIAKELRELVKYPRFYDFDHYTLCDEKGVYQNVSMGGVDKGNTDYELYHPITKKICTQPQGGWRYKDDIMDELLNNGQISFGKDETTVPRKKLYLQDYLSQIPKGVNFFDTQSDVRFLKDNNIPFDFPKPLDYLKYFAYMIDDKDCTVLDFFSGSATTAHAVMQLNAEDGGNRKFIMVQVNELTYDGKKEKYVDDIGKEKERFVIDESTGYPFIVKDSEARKAGFWTIQQIGKERIRRAGEKIKHEIKELNEQLVIGEEPKQVPDIGFKVFRTADTNIKWNLMESEGQMDIDAMTHTPDLADFTYGFNDIDVVYEIMLRQKDIPLSEKLEVLSDLGPRTYFYGSAYLICLETVITEELINQLAGLNPLPIKFVFRDSAFKDDINLKDDTFRRLKNLIERNAGANKRTYTVEFI